MEDTKDKADYSQGKIYKIVCNKTGLVYIGSTYRSLEQRLIEHENDMKHFIKIYKTNPDKLKKTTFCTSFFIFLNKDYKIELIENYPCNTRLELETKECYYMKLNQESVNLLRWPLNGKPTFDINSIPKVISEKQRRQYIKDKLQL
jgi:hypothetical protein